MANGMPHLDEVTPPLQKSIDLELARSIHELARGGEAIVIRLLADHQPDDPELRRAAYSWLYQSVTKEIELGELR